MRWSLWTAPLDVDPLRGVLPLGVRIDPREAAVRGFRIRLAADIGLTEQGGYGSFSPARPRVAVGTPTGVGDQLIELGAGVLQALDLDGVVALVAAMDTGEVAVDQYFEHEIVRRALAEPGIRERLRAQPTGPVAETILAELRNVEMDSREQLRQQMIRDICDCSN